MLISETSYVVNLDFEAIKLPPVTDILILGKENPQGRIGVLHSFNLLSPDVFEMIEIVGDDNVESIIVNRNILSKIDKDKIISILQDYVFPFVSRDELIRVNLNVKIYQRNIKGDIDVYKDVSATK
jgi:hypothetical protein